MTITEKELKPGDAGVADTIELMNEYAVSYSRDPRIKKLVKKITAGLAEETQKMKAVFKYIVTNMRYESDPPDAELVMSPKHTILGTKKYGDCDDLSTALVCLLLCAGIKCGFKTVAWKPGAGDSFSHVYVVAEWNNGLIPLDPTMKEGGFGKEVPHIRRSKIWKAG